MLHSSVSTKAHGNFYKKYKNKIRETENNHYANFIHSRRGRLKLSKDTSSERQSQEHLGHETTVPEFILSLECPNTDGPTT